MSAFKKIFLSFIILVVLVFGISFVLNKKDSTEITNRHIAKEDFNATNQGENQEFLRVLRSLENVTLKSKLFELPAFLSLVDLSVELKEEPKGRNNPFRPIDSTERNLAISLISTTSSEGLLTQ
ncbi:MAG TPA: hypothetical protein VJI73_04650 [Candidatus Paceibacterota bacterium]